MREQTRATGNVGLQKGVKDEAEGKVITNEGAKEERNEGAKRKENYEE